MPINSNQNINHKIFKMLVDQENQEFYGSTSNKKIWQNSTALISSGFVSRDGILICLQIVDPS